MSDRIRSVPRRGLPTSSESNESEFDRARQAEIESVAEERDSYRAAMASAQVERDAARTELDALRAELLALHRERNDEVALELKQLSSRLTSVRKRVDRIPRTLLAETQALYQLLTRYSPEATLPAVAGFALSPTGLLAMTDLVESLPTTEAVVECGSGTSTLWIAYALRRSGKGKVIALDHLPEYAARTRSVIQDHGLSEFADVRDAPLVTRSTPRGDFRWYDFDPASVGDPVGVLLVDGPPGGTGPLARYPALPIFAEFLAPNAHIMLDDTDRTDESKMLDIWLAEDSRLRRGHSPGPGLEILTLADARGAHPRSVTEE